MCRSTE
jgi:hypothetical protein